MRTRRPYPRHRYPSLLTPVFSSTADLDIPMSPQQQRILKTLQAGARVLFDVELGRALVYRLRQGLEQVGELTVRTLAWLVRRGHLVLTGREGRLAHYQYVAGA